MRKFGVNPFFRPVRVKIQSALFLFDDMQISGRVSEVKPKLLYSLKGLKGGRKLARSDGTLS